MLGIGVGIGFGLILVDEALKRSATGIRPM